MEHSTRVEESTRRIKILKHDLLDRVAAIQADYFLFTGESDSHRAVMQLQILDKSLDHLSDAVRELRNEYECLLYHESEMRMDNYADR